MRHLISPKFAFILVYFGKQGLLYFYCFWCLYFGIFTLLTLRTIFKILKSSKYFHSDWEERKKIVLRENKAFPKEITPEMLKQIMKVTNLPQQQVITIMSDKIFIPKGVIVFPDLSCYKYVPVYFENKNYYLYKTGSTLIFSVINKQKKLISYRVEQSEVDFVYKCEKLANDIKNYPLKYENKKI